MDILLSNEAIGLYTLLVVFGLGWLVKQGYIKKTYLDIAKDVFLFVEQNYKKWGIQGDEKLDFFIEEFIERYVNKFDEDVTDELIDKIVELVEHWVKEQHIVEGRVE